MIFPTHHISCTAFDPDLDSTGWAFLRAEVCRGELKPLILDAGLFMGNKKNKGLAATSVMIRTLGNCLTHEHSSDFFIVEAQEVYRDGKADANDLLRLAQITGAIQALTGAIPILPKTWKGNKHKEGMHARARGIFPPHLLSWEEPIAPRLRQHAWDAVCMALWKIQTTATERDQALLRTTPAPKSA
jgi:hypothetical protein